MNKIKTKYGYAYYIGFVICILGILLFLTTEQYKTEGLFFMLLTPALIIGKAKTDKSKNEK